MPTCPLSTPSQDPLSLWSIKSWAYIIVAISILLAISLQSILVYLLWIFYGDRLYLLGYICLSSIGFLIVTYAVMSLLNYLLDSPSLKHDHTYIYENNKYPHRPSVIDPNMHEYSHEERIKQDQEGGGMARGVPFDFNLKNSKLYKLLTNNPLRDLEKPVIRGIESGLDFVDGYLKRNIVIRFQDLLEDKQEKKRKILENQDEGEEEMEEEKEEVVEKVPQRKTSCRKRKKSTQFIKCFPCQNSKKCHFKTHVTFGNDVYHCQTYDGIVSSSQPRKKMSKVVIYGQGENDYECNKSTRDFFKAREKPKNWSAPNDYPNRNLHEMIQRKFPQIPDGVVDIFHESTKKCNNNENVSTLSNTENQKDHTGTEKIYSHENKRYCTLKKPCTFCQQNPLAYSGDQSNMNNNMVSMCSFCDENSKHKQILPKIQILPKVLLLYHNLTYDDY